MTLLELVREAYRNAVEIGDAISCITGNYFRQDGKLFTAVRRMVDYNLSRLGSPRSQPQHE